jgi:hypothetical protein
LTIDHAILFSLVGQYIPDRFVLRLIWQYLKRTVYERLADYCPEAVEIAEGGLSGKSCPEKHEVGKTSGQNLYRQGVKRI